jgi:hypothetical protein
VPRMCRSSALALALSAVVFSACGSTEKTTTVIVPARPTATKTDATAGWPRPARSARLKPCDRNIWARRGTTTCSFAQNVFYGYWQAQERGAQTFRAYSPTTGLSYDIRCRSGELVVCTGGERAEVRFSAASVRAYTSADARAFARNHDVGEVDEPVTGSVPPDSPPGSECDSNYSGACLDPTATDYDCEGGEGDGPRYTGPVTVTGDDHFGLDRDGDGTGCTS